MATPRCPFAMDLALEAEFQNRYRYTTQKDLHVVTGEGEMTDVDLAVRQKEMVDVSQHVRVYPKGFQVMSRLSPSALIIFARLSQGLDEENCVVLDAKVISEEEGIALNSVYRGLRELIEKAVISRRQIRRYWVNPLFMSRVNRVRLYQAYMRDVVDPIEEATNISLEEEIGIVPVLEEEPKDAIVVALIPQELVPQSIDVQVINTNENGYTYVATTEQALKGSPTLSASIRPYRLDRKRYDLMPSSLPQPASSVKPNIVES